jgi:putative oxidoreductase
MSSISQKLPIFARLLLGLVFVVFGLNFFLQFLPQPPMDAAAGAFLGALVAGKILTLVKVVEIGAGALLLLGRFVPLALLLLAPVLVGIVLFHAVYAPSGLILPLVLCGLAGYVAWSRRDVFGPLLRAQ